MSPEFVTATVRSIWGALVIAGGSFFSVLGYTGQVDVAGIAAGTAAFIYLGARSGVEGYIDTRRAGH